LITPEEFGVDREGVRLALEAENIESRPIWKPMHLQPVFRDCRVRGGEVSEDLFEGENFVGLASAVIGPPEYGGNHICSIPMDDL